MGEQKKQPSDQERMASLEQVVADQARTIARMQLVGGFADSKTLGVRCKRIEDRLELVEFDGEMLKDVAGGTVGLLEVHMRDRHDANFNRLDGNDVGAWCRVKHRMRQWAEKRGLMTKRRDMTDTRRDENRMRPVTA